MNGSITRLILRFIWEGAVKKQIILAGSLLSIVLSATVTNEIINSTEDGSTSLSSVSSDGRAPASAPTGTSEWEDQVAQSISKMPLSETMKIGRKPSSLDRLRIEFLEGKYAVRLNTDGRLQNVEFSQVDGGQDQPKYVNDRETFLQNYRELLPEKFERAERSVSKQVDQNFVEIYKLVGSNQQVLGTAEFQLDPAGRLISLAILPSGLVAQSR